MVGVSEDIPYSKDLVRGFFSRQRGCTSVGKQHHMVSAILKVCDFFTPFAMIYKEIKTNGTEAMGGEENKTG